MIQRPLRIENHRLEEESENYFRNVLPRNWTSFKPQPDYGIDLVVNIFDENIATSRELLVQLKSSRESNETSNGEGERLTLNVSTYNYLMEHLQVVLLVKYVASEEVAYWQLLSQIPEPNQENETMTVHIPKSNTFDDRNWGILRSYVEHIHLRKIGRREQIDLSAFV